MNTEWKPIASAPKDGAAIWAIGQIYGKPFQYECHWNGIEWYHGFGDGWASLEPSHWMPLPPAPTSHPIPTGATGEDGEAKREAVMDAIAEALGDAYAEAQGGVEGKLKHCLMIVAWANAAPQASEAVRNAANKSARAIAFDDWLAKHCDSDDLTAYERELALDAWNAARSSPQASAESIDLAGIDADRLRAIAASGSHTAMSNALLNIARALKTQADKDGAVCSCPTGDGSLRHPCAVHPDCAKGAAAQKQGDSDA